MTLNFQVIEDALYDWYSAQVGIPTIWLNQDSPQPAYPFATISIISGPNEAANAGLDELKYSTDLNQPQGQEVLAEWGGQRQMTVGLQVFTNKSPPSSHAKYLLTKVQFSLGGLSVHDQLYAAGLAVVRHGSIADLSEVVEDTWIDRASLDVEFAVAGGQSERTGYIKTVEITAPSPFDLNDKVFGDP